MAREGSIEHHFKIRKRAIDIIFKEGRMQSSAAKELNLHLRTIQNWASIYRKKGVIGLMPRRPPGRPRKLNAQQLKVLGKLLLQGAKGQGYANDLWTSKRILKLIEELAGVTYHHNHIPRLLKAMGWSVQRPQREAVEKDRKKIDEWIRFEWKRIKKKPAARGLRSSSSTSPAF